MTAGRIQTLRNLGVIPAAPSELLCLFSFATLFKEKHLKKGAKSVNLVFLLEPISKGD